MDGKFLGKISKVRYGVEPDCPFLMGLSLSFSLNGGSSDIEALYMSNVEWSNNKSSFTKKERDELLVETALEIKDILKKAKVNWVDQLKDVPVEVTIENGKFKDFRILTEVL